MTTHDKYKTREYQIWQRMKKSCYTKSFCQYRSYGKLGVRVCDRWKNSFADFLDDIGTVPPGYKGIRMKDPSLKIYSPENFEWVKESRGRPRKKMPLASMHKIFKKPVKIWLKLEKEQVDYIKVLAVLRSRQFGYLYQPSDIISLIITKYFNSIPPKEENEA